jgi:hypothetical protein
MGHYNQYCVRNLFRLSHVGLSPIHRGITILRLALVLGAGVASVCGTAFAVNATVDDAELLCVGDCDDNGAVTIGEVVKGVNIFLGESSLEQCPTFDCDGTGRVTIGCIIQAVNALLAGCPTPGCGTASFGAATNFGVGIAPLSVAVGDFNDDGKLDLAVANGGSNAVSILLGTGTGSFGVATNFGVGTNPESVAVGDFNGDGKLDLAVVNDTSNNVSILLGTGTGSFGAATDFNVGTSPASVAVGTSTATASSTWR